MTQRVKGGSCCRNSDRDKGVQCGVTPEGLGVAELGFGGPGHAVSTVRKRDWPDLSAGSRPGAWVRGMGEGRGRWLELEVQ